MGALSGLVAALLLQGAVAPAVCEADFHWHEGGGSIAVMPAADLVRIELSLGQDAPGRVGNGRLVLTAAADGLIDEDGAWAPAEAGLSLTPPGAAVTPGVWESGVWESRVRFGPRGAPQSPPTRTEIYPLQDGPHFEAWADFQRWTPEGARAVARFRDRGEVTAQLWRRGEDRPLASARFDWTDVQILVQRARAHYAGCPAG